MKGPSPRFNTLLAILFAGIALAASPSFAGKVYKWVDEDGKVTYRDKPPPTDSTGEVEIKELDSEKNVIQYQAPPEEKKPEADGRKESSSKEGKQKPGKDPKSEADKSLEKYIEFEEEQKRIEQQKAEERRRLEQQGSKFKKF